MKKGLEILADADNIVPTNAQMMQRDDINQHPRPVATSSSRTKTMTVDEAFRRSSSRSSRLLRSSRD